MNGVAKAYYNEIDPFAAAWLRELIRDGHIAPGEVDERDIRDVVPAELAGFTQCHFFAGIGGWSYALRRAGWPDDRPAWSASLPCQPFSEAGEGRGKLDERHLWPVFYNLVRERRPHVIFGEQVASPLGRAWLDDVSADMEDAAYVFGASGAVSCGVGGSDIRKRAYWLGHTTVYRARARSQQAANATEIRWPVDRGPSETNGFWAGCEWIEDINGRSRPVKPGTQPLAPSVPGRVGRVRGYGNAINAEVATAFIEAVIETLGERKAA